MHTTSGLSLCGALFALIVVADSSLARGLRHPECGAVSGRVLRTRSVDRSGIRITLRSGDAVATATTNRFGEFALHVPGPGPLTLLAEKDGAGRDSVQLEPMPIYDGHSVALELRPADDRARSLELERVSKSSHTCRGPARID